MSCLHSGATKARALVHTEAQVHHFPPRSEATSRQAASNALAKYIALPGKQLDTLSEEVSLFLLLTHPFLPTPPHHFLPYKSLESGQQLHLCSPRAPRHSPPTSLRAFCAKKHCYYNYFPSDRTGKLRPARAKSCPERHKARAGTGARFILNLQKQYFPHFLSSQHQCEAAPGSLVPSRDRAYVRTPVGFLSVFPPLIVPSTP